MALLLTMTMNDWQNELDRYLTYQRADILQSKGQVSREQANQKVEDEYEKFKQENHEVTLVDQAFFQALEQQAQKMKKQSRKND